MGNEEIVVLTPKRPSLPALLLAALVFCACNGQGAGSGDTDADADIDVDTDTDVDTDADTDTREPIDCQFESDVERSALVLTFPGKLELPTDVLQYRDMDIDAAEAFFAEIHEYAMCFYMDDSSDTCGMDSDPPIDADTCYVKWGHDGHGTRSEHYSLGYSGGLEAEEIEVTGPAEMRGWEYLLSIKKWEELPDRYCSDGFLRSYGAQWRGALRPDLPDDGTIGYSRLDQSSGNKYETGVFWTDSSTGLVVRLWRECECLNTGPITRWQFEFATQDGRDELYVTRPCPGDEPALPCDMKAYLNRELLGSVDPETWELLPECD